MGVFQKIAVMVYYIPNLINQLTILFLSQHRPFNGEKKEKQKRNTPIIEYVNYKNKSVLFQYDT